MHRSSLYIVNSDPLLIRNIANIYPSLSLNSLISNIELANVNFSLMNECFVCLFKNHLVH